MDFNDSPDEAAYRAQVKAWLGANAPKARAGGGDLEEDGSGLAAGKSVV